MPNVTRAQRCDLPSASRLEEFFSPTDYIESFAICADSAGRTMVEIYADLLGRPPAFFKHLIAARSLVVKPFGVRSVGYRELTATVDTSRSYVAGEKIGRWTLFAQMPDEIVAGEDDTHLSFRVPILRDRQATVDRLVLSTSVQTHNAFGQAYLAAILPFHRFGVQHLLRRGLS